MSRLRRRAPASARPGGAAWAAVADRGDGAVDRSAALALLRRRSPLTRQEAEIARPHPEGDQRAPRVPVARRPRLPDARPRPPRRSPAARAAHPAGDADRLEPGRRALHPRRALDRPAPARQRSACSRRSSGCATSATPCSSSSTIATRSWPPTTSSTWARARASTAATSSPQGTPAQVMAEPDVAHRQVSVRRELEIPVPSSRRPGNGWTLDGQRRAREQPAERHRRHSRSARSPASPASRARARARWSSTRCTRALAQQLLRLEARTPGAHDAINGWQLLDKVIDIDQAPIGRTPRSNPATYTGLFAHIRDLFAQLPEARVRGYGPGRFSFNVKGGRCEACAGDGADPDRDALPARRLRDVRGVRRAAATTARRSRCATRARASPTCST